MAGDVRSLTWRSFAALVAVGMGASAFAKVVPA